MSTYRIFAECSNCGNTREYEIPKGDEVRDVKCGDCECFRLSPVIRQVTEAGSMDVRNMYYAARAKT